VNQQSELAEIIKPNLPRVQWYKIIVEILPGERDKRFVELPGDYMVIVPLVLDGLPRWAGTNSSDMVVLEWKLGYQTNHNGFLSLREEMKSRRSILHSLCDVNRYLNQSIQDIEMAIHGS
jgi:hypothetical protein